MPSLPPFLPYGFVAWYLIKLWPWLQIPFQMGSCRSPSLVWCCGKVPHVFCVVLILTATQTWYSGSTSFSWNDHDNIKLQWHSVSRALDNMYCFFFSFYYFTYFTLGDRFKCQLYLLMACVFLAEHRHLNCYHTNTQRPAYDMLGHSPVLLKRPTHGLLEQWRFNCYFLNHVKHVLCIHGTFTIHNKGQCNLKPWPLQAQGNRKLGVIHSQLGFSKTKSLISARDRTMIPQSSSPLPSH